MPPALAVSLYTLLVFLLGYWFGQRSLRAYKRKLYRELYSHRSDSRFRNPLEKLKW